MSGTFKNRKSNAFKDEDEDDENQDNLNPTDLQSMLQKSRRQCLEAEKEGDRSLMKKYKEKVQYCEAQLKKYFPAIFVGEAAIKIEENDSKLKMSTLPPVPVPDPKPQSKPVKTAQHVDVPKKGEANPIASKTTLPVALVIKPELTENEQFVELNAIRQNVANDLKIVDDILARIRDTPIGSRCVHTPSENVFYQFKIDKKAVCFMPQFMSSHEHKWRVITHFDQPKSMATESDSFSSQAKVTNLNTPALKKIEEEFLELFQIAFESPETIAELIIRYFQYEERRDMSHRPLLLLSNAKDFVSSLMRMLKEINWSIGTRESFTKVTSTMRELKDIPQQICSLIGKDIEEIMAIYSSISKSFKSSVTSVIEIMAPLSDLFEQQQSIPYLVNSCVDHLEQEVLELQKDSCKEDVKRMLGKCTVLVKEYKSKIEEQNEFNGRVISELRKVLNGLRIVDVATLLKLLKGSQQSHENIRDEDAIFLIGNTGVGKSTVIHYLAGSQFHCVKANGLHLRDHYEPHALKSPLLFNVVTSPFGTSETSVINCVSVQSPCGESYWVVDTPGFEDTQGIETQIANIVSITKALKVCKRVKIVVCFSDMDFSDRLKSIPFRKLCETVMTMVKDVDMREEFSYIITKRNEKDKLQLAQVFAAESKGLDEYSTLKILWGDFEAKLRGDGAHIIDLGDDHVRFMIQEDLLQFNQRVIENPSVDILEFMAPDAREYLSRQIQNHIKDITAEMVKQNLPLVHYKLQQLRDLAELVGTSDCVNGYCKAVLAMRQSLHEAYEALWAFVGGYFEELNPLAQTNVDAFFSNLSMLSMFHGTLCEHLQYPQLAEYSEKHDLRLLEFLHQQIGHVLREKQNLVKGFVYVNLENAESIHIMLQNIKVLLSKNPLQTAVDGAVQSGSLPNVLSVESVVEAFVAFQSDVLQTICEHFQQETTQTMTMLELSSLMDLAPHLRYLQTVARYHVTMTVPASAHISIPKSNLSVKSYVEAVENINGSIKQYLHGVVQHLSTLKVSDIGENSSELHGCLTVFHGCINQHQDVFDLKALNEFNSTVLKHASKLLKDILVEIKASYNIEDTSYFKHVKYLLGLFATLRSHFLLEREGEVVYGHIEITITEVLKNLNIASSNQANYLFHDVTSFDSHLFALMARHLQQAWVHHNCLDYENFLNMLLQHFHRIILGTVHEGDIREEEMEELAAHPSDAFRKKHICQLLKTALLSFAVKGTQEVGQEQEEQSSPMLEKELLLKCDNFAQRLSCTYGQTLTESCDLFQRTFVTFSEESDMITYLRDIPVGFDYGKSYFAMLYELGTATNWMNTQEKELLAESTTTINTCFEEHKRCVHQLTKRKCLWLIQPDGSAFPEPPLEVFNLLSKVLHYFQKLNKSGEEFVTWKNYLRSFREQAVVVSKSRNISSLTCYAKVCGRMTEYLDDYLEADDRFKSLHRQLLSHTKGSIRETKYDIMNHNYARVLRGMRDFSTDIDGEEGGTVATSEQEELMEMLMSELNNHLQSVNNKLLSFELDAGVNAFSALWTDFISLCSVEDSLQMFYDHSPHLKTLWDALHVNIDNFIRKINAHRSRLIRELKAENIYDVCSALGVINQMVESHRCSDLLQWKTSTKPFVADGLCMGCVRCAVETAPKGTVMKGCENANTDFGLEDIYCCDEMCGGEVDVNGQNSAELCCQKCWKPQFACKFIPSKLGRRVMEIVAALIDASIKVDHKFDAMVDAILDNTRQLSGCSEVEDFEHYLPKSSLMSKFLEVLEDDHVGYNSSALRKTVKEIAEEEQTQINLICTEIDKLNNCFNNHGQVNLTNLPNIDLPAIENKVKLLAETKSMFLRAPINVFLEFKKKIDEYVNDLKEVKEAGKTMRMLNLQQLQVADLVKLLTNCDDDFESKQQLTQQLNKAVQTMQATLMGDNSLMALKLIRSNLVALKATPVYLETLKQPAQQALHKVSCLLESLADGSFKNVESSKLRYPEGEQMAKLPSASTMKLSKHHLDIAAELFLIYDNQIIEQDVFDLNLLEGMAKQCKNLLVQAINITADAEREFSDLVANCGSKELWELDSVRFLAVFTKVRENVHLPDVIEVMKNLIRERCSIPDLQKTVASLTPLLSELTNLCRGYMSELASLRFLSDKTLTPNNSDREQFYCGVGWRLQFVEQLAWLHHEDHKELAEQMAKNIQEIIAETEKYIGNSSVLLTSDELKDKFENFYPRFCNLKVSKECLKYCRLVPVEELCKSFDRFNDILLRDIESFKTAAMPKKYSNEDLHEFIPRACELMMMMKQIASIVPDVDKEVSKRLHDILQFYAKRQVDEGEFITKIGLTLNQDKNAFSKMILSEQQMLKGYDTFLKNTVFSQLTIEDLLTEIQGDKIARDLLHQHYRDFHDLYWEQVQKYFLKQHRGKKTSIIAETKKLVRNMSNMDQNDLLLRMMANVFAYWSLHNTSTDITDMRYLPKPHCGQVIAIFRLLGLDLPSPKAERKNAKGNGKGKNKNGFFEQTIRTFQNILNTVNEGNFQLFGNSVDLENHLVQIKTGEGKSVVLGVLSTMLALLDFDVDCVCYSKHLTTRDFEEFSPIFSAFEVQDRIYYGTFQELCERLLNRDGDIRSLVEQTITATAASLAASKFNGYYGGMEKKRIMLIDEVDVFFDPSFYGGIYNIYTTLKAKNIPEIGEVIKLIWSHRDSTLQPNAIWDIVESSAEYTSCVARFDSQWASLIEASCKKLLSTLPEVETHEYLFDESSGQVGYFNSDNTVSYKKVKGYNTLLAYLKEHEQGRIDDETLSQHLNFLIHAASFSYAEIPKLYHGILGVTGTLQTLSKEERNLLSTEFKVNRSTYMPSAYGRAKTIWDSDAKGSVRIEDHATFYAGIVDEINRRVNVGKNGQRAILVFFSTTKELEKFRDYPAFSMYKQQALVMVPGMKEEDRTNAINWAMGPGKVTLLTREFGRGTDFNCRDKTIDELGGVHVLQTFVSDEVSEEVQIMGRTARQGKAGTFSMVLLTSELEKFGLSSDAVAQMEVNGRRYSTINDYRQQTFEHNFPKRYEFLTEIRKDHEESCKFFQNIRAGNWSAVRDALSQRNQSQYGMIYSRTLILMDATYSMESLLDRAKQTVKAMLGRTQQVLLDNNVKFGFQIQFAVFRNYNSTKEQILESSSWESDPTLLLEFINGVGPNGGWGNEAIEIGLWHANQELQHGGVTQVILIGDAPANSISEVTERRGDSSYGHGEEYWKNSRFGRATNVDQELQTLIDGGVPVNAFYIKDTSGKNRAKANFEHIASMTGGKCRDLDIASSTGAETLTGVVAMKILNEVGSHMGDNGVMSQKLLADYKAKYAFKEDGFI